MRKVCKGRVGGPTRASFRGSSKSPSRVQDEGVAGKNGVEKFFPGKAIFSYKETEIEIELVA